MNAERDQNYVTVGMGIADDLSSTQPLRVNPVTGELLTDDTPGAEIATAMTMDERDQNYVPTVYGISDTDGTTLVPIRTDGDGNLLVDMH